MDVLTLNFCQLVHLLDNEELKIEYEIKKKKKKNYICSTRLYMLLTIWTENYDSYLTVFVTCTRPHITNIYAYIYIYI